MMENEFLEDTYPQEWGTDAGDPLCDLPDFEKYMLKVKKTKWNWQEELRGAFDSLCKGSRIAWNIFFVEPC